MIAVPTATCIASSVAAAAAEVPCISGPARETTNTETATMVQVRRGRLVVRSSSASRPNAARLATRPATNTAPGPTTSRSSPLRAVRLTPSRATAAIQTASPTATPPAAATSSRTPSRRGSPSGSTSRAPPSRHRFPRYSPPWTPTTVPRWPSSPTMPGSRSEVLARPAPPPASPLQPGLGQALDELTLGDDEHDQHRDHRQGGRGELHVPDRPPVGVHVLGQGLGQGEVALTGQVHDRLQVHVPGLQEREDGHRRDRWFGQREGDPPEDSPPAQPIHPPGFLQLVGQSDEVLPHQEGKIG